MNVEPVSTTPGGKKGRPTPKRKAAEAARIRQEIKDVTLQMEIEASGGSF